MPGWRRRGVDMQWNSSGKEGSNCFNRKRLTKRNALMVRMMSYPSLFFMAHARDFTRGLATETWTYSVENLDVIIRKHWYISFLRSGQYASNEIACLTEFLSHFRKFAIYPMGLLVEYFLKFAPEGPQNLIFPKWPQILGNFVISENFTYKSHKFQKLQKDKKQNPFIHQTPPISNVT